MKRLVWIVAIIAVPLIVAQIFLTGPSRLNPSELPPQGEITVAVPSAPPSTLTIPVLIPLSMVRTELEGAAPRRVCGGDGGFFDVAWCFNRQDLSVSGSRNRDAVVVSAEVDGVVDPPLMSEISVKGTAAIHARLDFRSDWRIVPYTSASVDVDEALYTPLLFETMDVGEMIEAPMRSAVAQQGIQLQSSIAGDESFERVARDAWDGVCRDVPLESGGESVMQLRPQRATAAPAQVEGDYLRVQFGLDVETRVGPPEGEISCPFPETLESASVRPGGFAIHLPTVASYDVVQAAVKGLVEDLLPEDTDRLRVDRVELRPYAGKLHGSIGMSVRLPGLLGGWSEATVHILAQPQVGRTTIRLTDVELDTESTHVLLAIAGNVLDPFMWIGIESEPLVELSSLDLGEMGESPDQTAMVDEMRIAIERELEARLGRDVDVTAAVTGTSVADLAFDSEIVHVIGALNGDLSVTLGS